MIELTDRTRAIWFVSGTDKDWLASVEAIEADATKGRLTYRFRYHASPDPWDDRDRKNWYAFTGPIDRLIKQTQEVAKLTTAQFEGEMWELLRGTSTLEQFTEQFQQLPFVHARFEAAENGSGGT